MRAYQATARAASLTYSTGMTSSSTDNQPYACARQSRFKATDGRQRPTKPETSPLGELVVSFGQAGVVGRVETAAKPKTASPERAAREVAALDSCIARYLWISTECWTVRGKIGGGRSCVSPIREVRRPHGRGVVVSSR